MRVSRLVLMALLALGAGAPALAQPAAPAVSRPAVAPTAGATLHALLAAEWERAMADDPAWASSLGDRRWNTRWRDMSPQAFARRAAHQRAVLARLATFDRARLSEADRLNLDLFRDEVASALREIELKGHLMPLSHMGGVQTAHDLAGSLRFETVRDYEDWLARLATFPAHMEQTIALMREGVKAGLVPPRATMNRMPEQIAAQLPEKPEDSPFYKPFLAYPDALSEAERARLSAAGREAIVRHVIPAFRSFDAFFRAEYLPASPERAGLRNLPNGEALYAHYARTYTTSSLSPHRIHELGLAEVARIRREMEGVMAEVGFKGGLREFFAQLKQDPHFYGHDAKALLAEYRAQSRVIDPLLVKLFKTLPRQPYAIEPVPAELAPNSSAAYYERPAADGSRPGTFYVNLHQAEKRPSYEMLPLALHETVPGHHLQIALAQELSTLPSFRRYGGYTAYIEGWGLYSESLGRELGLYRDPYVRFGQLNMEMRRALRLVLDTGLHAEGWDREKAIAFFMDNAAKQELEVVNEVDRYLAWPGQALAYKVGAIKLQELRARATQRLGTRFDVREFHEQLLSAGALPLDVLERRIDAWIAARAR